MTEDSLLQFDIPAVERKKVIADFGVGSISSDGGLVLLRAAERRLRPGRDTGRLPPGVARSGAGGPYHTLPAMLRFRMFAIACRYEVADDCDALVT